MLIGSALEKVRPVIGGSMTVTVPPNTTSARAACWAPVWGTQEHALARTPRANDRVAANIVTARNRATVLTIAPAYHGQRAKEEPRPRRVGAHHLRGGDQTDPRAREIRDDIRRAAAASLRWRRSRSRATRRAAVHTWHPADDVPGASLDDAPVRRLRDRRGVQRALPLPARARSDRAVGGVRPSDADGLRRGRSSCRGR